MNFIMDNKIKSNIYFSDIFKVEHFIIEKYGALDISLICDNPAFVDPFLIFANPKYKNLHKLIIDYLKFLRDLSISKNGEKLNTGDFKQYYKFPEVKQAWLGYSVSGNAGLGLSKDFADSLYENLNKIFSRFGDEKITESSHLEKLCLIKDGIGVDKISDFTLNLIKKFLLEYTQKFAEKYLDKKLINKFAVDKVEFNFNEGIWESASFNLPFIKNNGKTQFVLLVPKEILTKDDTWISRNDFLENDTTVLSAIENDELRVKINQYFNNNLQIKLNKRKEVEKDYSKKSKANALTKTILEYPELIDYYIKFKEKNKIRALQSHIANPEDINFFLDTSTIQKEIRDENFKKLTSFNDCVTRIAFFKKIIESNSKSLYIRGKPLQEKQLQLMFKMATYNSLFDYNSEVNNGRGSIDFTISFGSKNKIGLELKLASNKKLRKNLLNQGRVYGSDSNLKHVIKIIFFFSDADFKRIVKILKEINKSIDNEEIFLVDCRKKDSASNV